ncbi:MAG: asparagine synthase (glutamine-hydrolyzing) [Acidimicrobiia bacterium]|nr:asparagine synthase (glutamine-hydrolyzing) [Acidimicrobiia bacterium]
MCGIAGFVTFRPPAGAESLLERMTTTLQHRGPDDVGYYHVAPAFLGHRRLSIVDLSRGHQPIYNEDRSRLILYNGEIFNHAELRPGLERAGHRYQTNSDTETVLHGWEEYGPACLDQFRGMFAFVIWDENERRLFAARDRLGKKPFYYYWDGELFAFASEIKALLEHPGISSAPNDALISEYLAFGYVSGEQTLFQGIYKLPAGHWLEWDLSPDGRPRLRVESYWDVPVSAATDGLSDADWIAETRRRLEETVRLRLMADVPLGTFLSGGVDSSAISALVQRISGSQVKTFSVGYREQAYSELNYAREAAAAIGTEHHEVILGREEFFQALPALIWHEDEPIAWPSSIALYFVSRLAAQQVKVVLTGEGSDELFGGYERYRWNQLNLRAASAYRFVPSSLRAGVRRLLVDAPLLRADWRRKLHHTFLGRELGVESLYLDNFYAAFSRQQQSELLLREPGSIYDSYLRYWEAHGEATRLQRMLYADQKTYLVELLMKQDQMSMASSIESRVPFLDHHFLAFAMRVPDRLRIHGSEQKYILKKAVEDLLPHRIVYRVKKGFPTPLRQWLRGRDAESVLSPLSAPDGFLLHYVRVEAVQKLLERHHAGWEDGTDRIWRLLNLAHWGEMHFGKQGRSMSAELAREQLNRSTVVGALRP